MLDNIVKRLCHCQLDRAAGVVAYTMGRKPAAQSKQDVTYRQLGRHRDQRELLWIAIGSQRDVPFDLADFRKSNPGSARCVHFEGDDIVMDHENGIHTGQAKNLGHIRGQPRQVKPPLAVQLFHCGDDGAKAA